MSSPLHLHGLSGVVVARVAPTGLTDLVGPTHHKPDSGIGTVAVLTSSWLLQFLATVALVARLYLRLGIQRRRLMRSDVMMIIAWFASLTSTAFSIGYHELGVLQSDVKTTLEGYTGDATDISKVFKASLSKPETPLCLFWVGNIPFLTSLYFCKAALLDMYLPMFHKLMVKRRIFLWVTAAFTALSYLASLLLIFTICVPISTHWDLNPNTTCPPQAGEIFFEVTWALHFSSDILVFALPWFVVPDLKIEPSIKLGLYATFLLGLVNISLCFVRFIVIYRQTNLRGVMPLNIMILFCLIESSTAIIIACLPSLRPYFGKRRASDAGTTKNTDMRQPVRNSTASHAPLRGNNG